MTTDRARVLMLQGTASHTGKTVLAAALCRNFARRGYRVAPFKAQNMSLNSFVTQEGAEMGRAQVYQARAAGLDPHVDMNPVLLKPSAGEVSQIVVMGRPIDHMTVRQYHAYQDQVWPVVTAALDRLRAANDLVVIEGAGSSAEVNLRPYDIANMRVALQSRAPVVLVGDIELGGVFASLLGHMELFAPEERALVAGFIINKFRGDAAQLDAGIRILRERTAVPTLGVVPYLEVWRSDEEDSVTVTRSGRVGRPGAPLRIVVVRLPYMSNFTDADALAGEPDVDLRFVHAPGEIEGSDAIVLPGSKSTIADLHWLRRSGLSAALQAAAAAGTPVVGICGGYQMLGRRILDPAHVESACDAVDGLGLLDVETTFAAEKRTLRVEGVVTVSGPLGSPGAAVSGYEIHMGRTVLGSRSRPLLRLRTAGSCDERPDGALTGAVCGTYLHGIFDHPEARAAFLNALRAARGLPPRAPAEPAVDDIDRLTAHVEAHLDLEAIERIVGLP